MDQIAKRLEAEERKPDLISIVPYKPVEPKVKAPMPPYVDRKRNFKIIEMGYTPEQAQRESARCFSAPVRRRASVTSRCTASNTA